MSLPVYDADAHICEPPAVWEKFCEPDYRDRVLSVRMKPDGGDSIWLEGRDLGTSAAPACIPGAYSDPNASWDMILPGS